ncbi:MAG: hypothetical protein M1831_007104 [Alyxoria varia]|nr:MAG: hypothetical protein M1831_007104 [Alyxoria varia]
MRGNIGPDTNAINWIFTSAAICIVLLRFLSRFRLSNFAGWDDLVILIALVLVILESGVTSYAISQGLGQHINEFEDPAKLVNALKWTVIADTPGIFVFSTPKLAFAILLDRILNVGKTSKALKALLYTPAVLSVLFSVAGCAVWLRQCDPIEGLWDQTAGAECLSTKVYLGVGLAMCAFSGFLDFYYGVIPILFISRLNMDTRRKIHISIMLGLGTVGGVVAIWKCTLFPAITVPDADVTYASAKLIYATVIEGCVLIIAASIPAIGPVLRVSLDKVASMSGRKSRSSYQQFDHGYDSNSHGMATPQVRSMAKGGENTGMEMQSMGRTQNVGEIVAETVVDVDVTEKTKEDASHDRWL